VAVLLTLGLAGFSPAAAQTTHTVTDCGDTVPGGTAGQTRFLVNTAASGDTIDASACDEVPLNGAADEDGNQSGDIDVTGDKILTIIGKLPFTVFNANGNDRVFDVLGNGELTLQNAKITGGDANKNLVFSKVGGGIAVDQGKLTLRNVLVVDNQGSVGGGIFDASAQVLVENSTITGNVATDGAGGGYNSQLEQDVVRNSTVSGNTATGEGGGIFNAGPMDLQNVTIANNQANSDNTGTEGGGGVFTGGVTNIINTLIANNTVGTGSTGPDCNTVTTQHNTLISDITGCTVLGTPDATDLTGTANILPLANNGGSTLTHALRGESQAVNAGAACPPTDQRGVARAGVCDIGAYEHDPTIIIAGYVNQVSYAPGETLTVGVNAFNGGAAMVVDVYAVILPPAGVVPGCTTSAAFVIIGGAVLLCADTTPFDQFPALA
jgi:hypothetical protein